MAHRISPTLLNGFWQPTPSGLKAPSKLRTNGCRRNHKRSQIRMDQKRCLRCNTLYQDNLNSPTACFFHGHANGEKRLHALAPPHQGIDGEWSDRSGVIVYRWNEKDNRPNTRKANWKKRWSCCSRV